MLFIKYLVKFVGDTFSKFIIFLWKLIYFSIKYIYYILSF